MYNFIFLFLYVCQSEEMLNISYFHHCSFFCAADVLDRGEAKALTAKQQQRAKVNGWT